MNIRNRLLKRFRDRRLIKYGIWIYQYRPEVKHLDNYVEKLEEIDMDIKHLIRELKAEKELYPYDI